ncbi:MAG: hypothetical protein ACM3H7_03595 [Acidobacteriaceae bacterium]
MKRALLIGLIVALVLILVGGAGVAYAAIRGIERNTVVKVNAPQVGDKIIRPFVPGSKLREFGNVFGPGGMMGQYGDKFGPGGMMGQYGDEFGPGGMMGQYGHGFGPGGMMGGQWIGRRGGIMHDYMISAFADAVGLSVEDVDARLANGETFKEIAIAQGTTESGLPALAEQVRKAALDKAVADGVITQAQADLMLEHMDDMGGWGFGPGDCPMWDGDEVQP